MSEYNITVEGGTSKRLLTAGRYCDRDIVVTAEGGGGGGNTDISQIEFVNLTIMDTNTPVCSYAVAKGMTFTEFAQSPLNACAYVLANDNGDGTAYGALALRDACVLCVDKEKTNMLISNTPINEDLTLYANAI